jgi:putative NADH-flavin reductase
MSSNMKKIVLIGASGFIGSVILREAIDRGHLVTGVVRHPEKITLSHKNLHIEKADIFFTEKITGIFKGADAVISSYNPGWTNPKISEETTAGYKSIIEGVRQSGVKRLMIVGGAGSLFVTPGKRLMDTGAIPESYMPAIRALANVFLIDLANEKDIDWVFFSPAINIHPGTRTGKFRLGKDDVILNQAGEGDISVEDYAVAMIDELENPVHHHERFTIGY